MSLTEEVIERLGGTAGVGAASVAALLLARPLCRRPIGRGLRALAKGAIKGYLIVATKARVAVHEATDEWHSLYDQARAEIVEHTPGRNGRISENGAAGEAEESRPIAERRAAEPEEREVQNERVNLNAADKEALMLLPGVGERTAEKILQYREEHGRIRNLQELQDADILFESTAENLRTLVGF